MMTLKKQPLLAFLAIFLLLSSCSKKKQALIFGEQVDTTQALPVSELASKMGGNSSMEATISGKVQNVCKAEGCWLKLDCGNDDGLMVRMKDHAFTVPEKIQDKFAFIIGRAYYDTLSIEKLRDNAKDEGASPAVIAAISQPEFELVFEAKGISIR